MEQQRTVIASDFDELQALLDRIKAETWRSAHDKRNVMTGIIMAMGVLRASDAEARAVGARPHLARLLNDHSSRCHVPHCQISWGQHGH